MVDIAAIGSALSSLKVLYDLAKGANDANLALKMGSAVADLQGKLLDVQIQAQSIQEENVELKRLAAELRAALKAREDMKFKQGAYYTKDDGPFCQHYWESDQKVIHLCRLMPAPDAEPITDPNTLVYYTCAFHPFVRVVWPLAPSKFIAALSNEA
jgi:hypothetical protein